MSKMAVRQMRPRDGEAGVCGKGELRGNGCQLRDGACGVVRSRVEKGPRNQTASEPFLLTPDLLYSQQQDQSIDLSV